MGIIHLANIVGEAIGDNEVVYMEEAVISDNLVEYLLGDVNGGSFVLNNHTGLESSVVEYGIGTERLVAHLELQLIGQKRGGVVLVADKVVNEMLSDPFFRGQRDVFPAQRVENLTLPVGFAYFYLVGWQV